MVALPLDILNLALAVVLPMLTALITARYANSAVKTCVLVALSVIAVALQGVFQDDGILHVREFIIQTSLQFFMAVGAHFGLLKPLSVTGESGVVASAVPAGVGGPKDQPGNVEI
jgi:hypothetical membrane protein